jgi:maleate cis-trans isomerase
MKVAATPIRVGLIIPSSNVTVETELPVLSASTATAFTLLRRLELPTVLPGAGRLLQQDRRDTR